VVGGTQGKVKLDGEIITEEGVIVSGTTVSVPEPTQPLTVLVATTTYVPLFATVGEEAVLVKDDGPDQLYVNEPTGLAVALSIAVLVVQLIVFDAAVVTESGVLSTATFATGD
jgi:hypothetical protein